MLQKEDIIVKGIAILSRRSFLMSSIASTLVVRGNDQHVGIQLLKTPNRGLQPQAAIDSKGIIHLIYLYGDPAAADIGYSHKKPGESKFSPPVRVNSQPGSAIAIGTVRGAHLAIGKSNRIHVAWNGSSKAEPKGPGNSAPMLCTRLNDQGDGFEPQRNVMPTASGVDGGGTVAADSEGNVYVTCHARGRQNGQPMEGEEHRRVWLVRSADDGRIFDAERAVSPVEHGACGCCGMGAIADQQGNLYLLYRSAREVIHRDMCLLISRDRGRTFQTTKLDSWQIGACPMSTASFALGNGRVLASWETDKQVYFAAIDIRTKAIGKAVAAPGESRNRKHPAIASNERGDILLVWTDGTGWKKGGSLGWQLFDAAGQPLPGNGISPGLPAWDFAAAVPVKNDFLLVS